MKDSIDKPRSEQELLKEEGLTTVISEIEQATDSGTETPTCVHTFDEIATQLEQYLPNTRVALKILLAVATSGTRKNRVMLWMLFVGPPSSGKTDLLKLIKNSSSVHSLDSLTLNAFISGERQTEKQKVYDLLAVLDKKCLVIKDWTVIFSQDERMTKKVIGDMVGAYDKVLAKFSTRRGNVTYQAEFSHIGAITPATLNQHHNYLNQIGQRFLMYTMPPLSVDDEEKSFKVIFSGENRMLREKQIAETVTTYLTQLNTMNIDIVGPFSEKVQHYFRLASNFMARSRGIVILQLASFQNETGDTISYYEPLDVQIEQPWRAVQQLMILARYLAFVAGKRSVDEEELEIIREVVISSMPADRSQALRAIRLNPTGVITAKELSEQVDKSDKTARRLLQELMHLKIVKKTEGSGTLAASYEIADEFKQFISVDPRELLSAYSKNENKQLSLD